MSREAMQMALEALELLARYENPSTKIQVRKPKDGGPIVTMYPHKVATEAAALLRERLAQPEQEQVAWQPIESVPKTGRKVILFYKNRLNVGRTVTARWLTDEQATEIDADDVGLEGGWYECIDNWDDFTEVAIHEGEPSHWMPLPAPPIEAKLKEKNT